MESNGHQDEDNVDDIGNFFQDRESSPEQDPKNQQQQQSDNVSMLSIGSEDEEARRLRYEQQDAIERAKLFAMITSQETYLQEEHVRRQKSPEEAKLEEENMYRMTRYQIGYHVDCWPPKPVASRLHVRKVPNDLSQDRMILIKERIDKFRARPRFIPEESNDTVVIIVENDEIIDKFVQNTVFQKYSMKVVRESDLIPGKEKWVRDKVAEYEKVPYAGVFLCTLKMENFSIKIPFAKFNIFNTVADKDIFNAFVYRQTIESRLHKESATIYVPINTYDTPEIIENMAMMLGLRDDDIDSKLLDFVEQQCWLKKPNERRAFEMWANSIKAANLAEDEKIYQIIGPRVQFWWYHPTNLDVVKQHVKARKEVKCQSARPWEEASPDSTNKEGQIEQ